MDERHDQASGLRRATQVRPVKVITIASGKGGVGKTTVAVNLALSLAKAERSVMLMDADLGLANVDVQLGLQPRDDLSDVLAGECTLEEIILTGPHGLRIVPAASGKKRMADLGPAENAGLIHAFSELTCNLDTLIVDAAAGISDSVASFAQAAHEVVVVVCDEPASITDAYALIKVLSRDYRVGRFQVLTNLTRDAQDGRNLFEKIARVSDRFLDVSLEHCGNIPFDPQIRRAVQRQTPVVELYPGSNAARAFNELARRCDSWQPPLGSRGHVEFFAERLVGTAPVRAAACG